MPGDNGLGNVDGNDAQAPQDSVCGVFRKGDMTPISSADIQRWLKQLFIEFNVPQYAEHAKTLAIKFYEDDFTTGHLMASIDDDYLTELNVPKAGRVIILQALEPEEPEVFPPNVPQQGGSTAMQQEELALVVAAAVQAALKGQQSQPSGVTLQEEIKLEVLKGSNPRVKDYREWVLSVVSKSRKKSPIVSKAVKFICDNMHRLGTELIGEVLNMVAEGNAAAFDSDLVNYITDAVDARLWASIDGDNKLSGVQVIIEIGSKLINKPFGSLNMYINKLMQNPEKVDSGITMGTTIKEWQATYDEVRFSGLMPYETAMDSLSEVLCKVQPILMRINQKWLESEKNSQAWDSLMQAVEVERTSTARKVEQAP